MEDLTREIADCVVDRFAASNLQDDIAGRVVVRMQAQIAVEHIERVKAWRIGVNILGFLFGLFLGLYASRLPVGLTADLLACPYNYDKLDTKYALALEAKQTQLAGLEAKCALELEVKIGALVMNNSALALDNQRLMLEVDWFRNSTMNSNAKHWFWDLDDMLWV